MRCVLAKASIVIPTYNERKNIPILLKKLDNCLNHIDKEVIVVDDDSPDKTWEVASELSSQYPWLKVFRRTQDKGLSAAVLAGFFLAEGDYLAVMDADLQHDEQCLPKLLQALDSGADIAIGSRKADGGGIENWSLIRKFISWVATLMARIVLQHPVTDPMSGFFAIKRHVYLETKNEINPKGFKILLEFLARSKKPKIQEVGYTFRGRIHGESKLSGQVVFDYLAALCRLGLAKLQKKICNPKGIAD